MLSIATAIWSAVDGEWKDFGFGLALAVMDVGLMCKKDKEKEAPRPDQVSPEEDTQRNLPRTNGDEGKV